MSRHKPGRRGNVRGKLPVEHSPFYPYLQRYLEARLVLGLSKATNDSHDSHLRRLIVWCEERDLQRPQDITKPILERYQRHLHYYRQANGKPLTLGSQQVWLSAVKAFFKWLTQENYLLYNPASELKLPKLPKKLPRAVLSEADVANLLAQPDLDTPSGIRDRSLLELFYSCGLRRTELLSLCCQDVNVKRQLLIVKKGKGGRERYLPIGDRATLWLKKYVEDVRDELLLEVHQDRLFLTDDGAPFQATHLGQVVKKYLKQAEIDVTGSCHLLRHAMATHMLERGADIRFIQAMLGHEDLSTTEIYTQVSVEKLREVHRATHPAKLKAASGIDADGDDVGRTP
jgi:integrase/recombinase XerD